MNNETRKALVEELARAHAAMGSAKPYNLAEPSERAFRRNLVEIYLMPIIERLLVDRAATAADAVEAVAKAIWDYERKNTDWETWGELPKNYGKNGIKGQAYYRDLARAAIAAMPEPDDNWLDELPAKAWLNVQCNEAGCVAVIQMPKRSGARYLSGTGPTRIDAIADAVRQAKENGDELA